MLKALASLAAQVVMVKRWLPWIVKLVLTGGIFWFLATKVDLAAAWERARTVEPSVFAIIGLVYFAQFVLCTVRWRAVMEATGEILSPFKTFEIFLIGTFFNIVLPGAVGGDAIRIWKARRAGLSLTAAVNGVMLERIATVFGLVLLVTITQPMLLARIGDIPGSWVFPALTAAGIAGLGFLCVLDQLPETIYRFRILRGIAQLAADTRQLIFHPWRASRTLVYSILGHANLSLAVYLLARGLQIDVTMLDCLALVPPVILIMTLPISIAGWGVREGAMVVAFGFIGVDAPHALALSVLFGIVTIVTSLPGGLFLLSAKDRLPSGQEAESPSGP